MAIISSNKINIKQNAKANKMFYDKVKVAIQKIGTSNKTKVLHKLAQEEVLYIGFGTADVVKESSRFGLPYIQGDKLSGLLADIKYTISKADQSGIASSLQRLVKIGQEESRVKTTITDTSDYQLNKLEKERNKLFEDLLEAIDYFDLLDIYYSLYLEALYKRAEKDNGKNKLFVEAHKVFGKVIEKTIEKYRKDNSENDKELEIVVDYTFACIFTQATKGSIISSLTRMYSEERVAFLKDQNPPKISEFKQIAEILTMCEIVNVTPAAFVNNAQNTLSEKIVNSINADLASFVSVSINSNYKSTVFDAVLIDKESQTKLENLLLNYKSKIIIKN